MIYISLPHLYMEWFKENVQTSISVKKSKRNLHSSHQINTCNKNDGNFWYDLLKYIFIVVHMIRRPSEYAVLYWAYKTYKSILAFETHDILIETKNSICFEILTK